MIPMLRVFSSGKLRAMVPFVGVESWFRVKSWWCW
jgi:hypothetical protein